MAHAKLGRNKSARRALFRDLTTDLIINERIETTEAKAKELRPIVERMVTLAKRGDLHARRQAATFIRNEMVDEEGSQNALQKLFGSLGPRFAERQGGYTRILKMGPRKGDNAERAIIEFVS